MKKLSREELIDLVQRLLDNAGTDDQIAEWITELKANVPHPHPSDLVYWNFKQPLTAESIVDEALSYPAKSSG